MDGEVAQNDDWSQLLKELVNTHTHTQKLVDTWSNSVLIMSTPKVIIETN